MAVHNDSDRSIRLHTYCGRYFNTTALGQWCAVRPLSSFSAEISQVPSGFLESLLVDRQAHTVAFRTWIS